MARIAIICLAGLIGMFFKYFSFWPALGWTLALLIFSTIELHFEDKREKELKQKNEQEIEDEIIRRVELAKDLD